jgi:hypothetical protein
MRSGAASEVWDLNRARATLLVPKLIDEVMATEWQDCEGFVLAPGNICPIRECRARLI